MDRPHVYFVAMVVMLLFAGCASPIKPYARVLPDNLEIVSSTESVDTSLDIYRLEKQCEVTYLGTMTVDRETVSVGIEPGKPAYLVIGFSSSSFWGSSSSYINYDFTLLPRKGYRYRVRVSYADAIYNVIVDEIDPKAGNTREMSENELQQCG
ncbi:MAG: hypothetical protein OEN02_13900 [Gammaproteobacteria bacterium]|nr:hypothetical protein [Gammaproteobacteria bacterium]MDH3538172.1 hypothetical protein [Gammaproteobacteria bacterium]